MSEGSLVLGFWVLLVAVTLPPTYPPPRPEPCDELYAQLAAVPHVSLTKRVGPFESLWSGEPLAGCEIAFETNDSTLGGRVAPDFRADPGTDMYGSGWRAIPEILADGAGSGVHGIRKEATRCLIRWEQPAYVDDGGGIVQSATLTILVQCSDRPPGVGLGRESARSTVWSGDP